MVQVSDPVDMTINNNVIKTMVNDDNAANGYFTNSVESKNFRKYPPGYTLDADVPIDIQLRDERDRIIDLNGANWVMVAYATIHS